MSAKPTILSDNERHEALKDLPGWHYDAPNIVASFQFPDFKTVMAFITIIGIEVKAMDHHPEFTCSYKNITLSLCTHSVGNKISDLDIKMAHIINDHATQLRGVSLS